MDTKQSSSLLDRLLRPTLIRIKQASEQDFYKDIIGLFLLASSLFLIFTMASFNPKDPSPFTVSIPSHQATNLGGIVGASASGTIFYYIGVSGLLLPIWFIHSLWCFYSKDRRVIHKTRILGWVSLLFICSCLFSIHLKVVKFETVLFSSAGYVGDLGAGFLQRYMGSIGNQLVLWFGFLGSMILLTEKPLLSITMSRLRRIRKPKLKLKLKLKPSQKSVARTDPVIETHPEPTNDVTHSAYKHNSKIFPTKVQHYKADHQLFTKTSKPLSKASSAPTTEQVKVAEELKSILSNFNISGEIVKILSGPVVTVYEFQPRSGTKLSKVLGLVDDIALGLRVESIFINPVPSRKSLGIEVPNESREFVLLGDLVTQKEFDRCSSPLTFALGCDLSGSPLYEDLTEMPHLLIAGQTGSGKSIAINTLLCSLLAKADPNKVRMILVDPKVLELKVYEGIPHLLMPVITEATKASLALKWACREMEKRYRLMESIKVRNINDFNKAWHSLPQDKRKKLTSSLEYDEFDHLPFLVIVIDELADLMLSSSKEVEGSIQKLAQKARASGIHLVLATQRPSVDVVTGVIKANLPCRMSFKVFSRGDSRTILDSIGAERLLGKGDLLFLKPGTSKPRRAQGAFISDQEVINIVECR